MNAYVIAGGVLALWAVLVAVLGMRGFPRSKTGERAAIGITAVLFVTAVGSAVGDTTKVGERHGPHGQEEGHAADEGAAPAEPAQPTGGAQSGGNEPAPEAAPEAGPSPEAGGEPTALTLSADPAGALKFDKTALEAKAGSVTVEMTNPSPVPHDVALRGDGVDEKGEVVQDGGKSTVTADLQPGRYEFYCSVPGHEQAGMKGTLTVE